MSIPKPTASRTANIAIADVARIEPRSRFLPACLFDLLFMCFPLWLRTKIHSANSYQGRTDSGLKSTRTAFATGRSGFVVRVLLTDPEVLVCFVSAALFFCSSTLAGVVGVETGVEAGVSPFCPETL